jgi:hypothetical protein
MNRRGRWGPARWRPAVLKFGGLKVLLTVASRHCSLRDLRENTCADWRRYNWGCKVHPRQPKKRLGFRPRLQLRKEVICLQPLGPGRIRDRCNRFRSRTRGRSSLLWERPRHFQGHEQPSKSSSVLGLRALHAGRRDGGARGTRGDRAALAAGEADTTPMRRSAELLSVFGATWSS